MQDPRRPGYANLSGVHKYFYELVAAAPDGVEYVFVNGGSHEGTKLVGSTDGNTKALRHEAGRLWRENHDGTKARRGMGRLLPQSVRLVLGYGRDIVRLARILRTYRDKVDLLHVVAGGCEISPIAAKLAGFRHVIDTVQAMHGEEPEAEHWVRRLVERLCFRCSDYHIFVSDATRESWEKRLGRSFPKSCTIYNGMQPPDFSHYDRMTYRRQFVDDPEGCFIVGICARLHHMKGHRVLIEAFAELFRAVPQRREDAELVDGERANHEGTKTQREESEEPRTKNHEHSNQGKLMLLIAGEGPERGNIEAQIAGLPKDVADRIKLVGHREDPCVFVACLDLHVMASMSIETIGYANIEAMFAGVPCIVSDVGGANGSGGGKVVKAGSVEELREAILLYINAGERAREDGKKGKDYASKSLSSTEMVHRVMSVYLKLMRS